MAVAHDPGGKVRLPLLEGVSGRAEFSECGRYRYWLVREWGFRQYTDGREPFVLWIGANPSTAEAAIDDPTIRKEIGFTRRLKYDQYVKANVMDYRATYPMDLRLRGVAPCSDKNLSAITFLADKAAIIVCCWGAIHKSLRHHADDVLAALKGRELWCLGRNHDGSPRH